MKKLMWLFTIRRRERSIVEKVFTRSLVAYMSKNFTQAIGALVDGIVIGKALGVDAMAAYSLVWPLTLAHTLVGGMLSGGSRNLYAKLAGHGDTGAANHVFTLAALMSTGLSVVMVVMIFLFLSPVATLLGARGENAALRPLACQYLAGLILGLPFDNAAKVLASYMGIDSDHRRLVLATVAMTATDIVGDIAAITFFQGSMFALGAATALGEAVYCGVLATHFLRRDRMLHICLKGVTDVREKIKTMFSNGTPYAVNLLSSVATGVFINLVLSSVAQSAYIAAYGIQRSISSVVWITYLGVADTVWVLASIYYGEEDRKALIALQNTATRKGIAVCGGTAILLVFFPRFFAGIYIGTGDSLTLSLATEAVRLLGFSVPLYLAVYAFDYYLMGTGKLRAANFYNLLLECGVVIPVVWLMVTLFGGRGVWLATPVILLFMLGGAILYISKWKNGDSFSEKCLLLGPEFTRVPGEELSISADTLVEVMGMSRIAGLFCRENGIDPKKANTLALCIEELGVNIIEHGFSDDAQHTIDMRVLVKRGELILRIRDDCKPFNLMEQYRLFRDQEDVTRNIGIRMVVRMSRDVQYLSTMNTNNLIIRV